MNNGGITGKNYCKNMIVYKVSEIQNHSPALGEPGSSILNYLLSFYVFPYKIPLKISIDFFY